MPRFGTSSTNRLSTVHRDLQTILREAIKYVDFSVVYGHRTPEVQAELYAKGRDKKGHVIKVSEVVTYKDGTIKKSKHNFEPSRAVDIIPYPTGWKNELEFYFMAGIVMEIADRLYTEGKIDNKITWGGRWKTLVDLPHFQIS